MKKNNQKQKHNYPKERKGERVKFIIKKSPAYVFWPMFWFIIGFLFLIAVVIVFGFSVFFTFVFLFWAIVLGGLFFYNIYLMARSVTIITSERIIDIEQNSLFSRRVHELEIKNIQKVQYKKTGSLAHLYNAGSLYIYIKDTNQFMPIEFAKDPEGSAEKIEKLIG